MGYELFINKQKVDLLANDRIAQTIQVNDIGDIKSRQASYTNSFKIPRTAKNIRAFDLLGITGSVTNIHNEVFKCDLHYETLPFIVSGKGALRSVDSKYYTINIYFGNSKIYQALSGKSLRDLDLSEYDHVFNEANLRSTFSNTEGIIYALALFKKPYYNFNENYSFYGNAHRRGNIDISSFDDTLLEVNLTEWQFSFFEHTLFKKVLESLKEIRLKYNFEFESTEEFKSKLITSDRGRINTVGEVVSVNDTLPDIDQFEFIKDIANRYGLIFQVTDMGTFELHRFQGVTENRNQSEDWSEKLASEESKMSFRSNYAKKNYFKYGNGGTSYFDFYFPVNDEKIKAQTKTVFESIYDVPKIEMISGGIDGAPFRTVELLDKERNPLNVKPNLCSLSEWTGTWKLNQVSSPSFETSTFPILSMDGLGFNELCERHYKNMIATINENIKLELFVYFKAFEFLKLNLTTPKFIRQLGGYFYLNKVSNFVPGKPTKCELIKISKDIDLSFDKQNGENEFVRPTIVVEETYHETRLEVIDYGNGYKEEVIKVSVDYDFPFAIREHSVVHTSGNGSEPNISPTAFVDEEKGEIILNRFIAQPGTLSGTTHTWDVKFFAAGVWSEIITLTVYVE